MVRFCFSKLLVILVACLFSCETKNDCCAQNSTVKPLSSSIGIVGDACHRSLSFSLRWLDVQIQVVCQCVQRRHFQTAFAGHEPR